jgi:uncharacterized repeat protein (TIGR04076 family)
MAAKYQTIVEVKRINGKCPAHKEGDKFEGYVPMMGGVSHWLAPWTSLEVHLK